MLSSPTALISGIAMFSIVEGLAAPTPEQLGFFESKVRPLLADQCYRCHSHRAEKLKGGLYLDHGSTALAGGDAGPVIVPGEPEKSLLVEAVRYENPELQMPPKKKLAAEEITVLEKWVAMGAPWPDEPVPRAEKRLGPKHFDLAGMLVFTLTDSSFDFAEPTFKLMAFLELTAAGLLGSMQHFFEQADSFIATLRLVDQILHPRQHCVALFRHGRLGAGSFVRCGEALKLGVLLGESRLQIRDLGSEQIDGFLVERFLLKEVCFIVERNRVVFGIRRIDLGLVLHVGFG